MTPQRGSRVVNEPELARGPLTQRGKEASERLRSRVAIAKAIIEARLQKNWTQLQLAEAAGTKQSRISELEGIRGNPTLETIDRVAGVLELELSLRPAVLADSQRYVAKQKSLSTVYIVSHLGPAHVFQCEADPFEANVIPPKVAARMHSQAKLPRYA